MTPKTKTAANVNFKVPINDSIEGLNAVKQPLVAAAIWRRTPLSKFQTWIDSLPDKELPSARIALPLDAIQRALMEVMQISGMPACVQRDMLIDDIAALANVFAEINQTKFLRLRLEAITGNACSKFHIDAVTTRLVCTYRGPGTQYCFLADGTDSSNIFDVPTSSPIVMRGTLWPTKERSGFLNRSPPIEGSGKTRLLLVLDPISDPKIELNKTNFSIH
ncbi:DUF1826 domain-containing protein [Alphaproteobacteria bacterium]|nr:DUF1826 domain-containing protein [Alphaproteobacteria bacterium]